MYTMLHGAFVALIASSSPQAMAYNALKNGDFSGNASNWNTLSTGGGVAGYEGSLGSPTGGSLRLQSFNLNATAHADQCVDIHRWFSLDFGLRKFNNAESGGGSHKFRLDIYDTENCVGNVVGTVTLPDAGIAVGNNWFAVSVDGTMLPSGAVSAKVSLDTIAGPAGVSYYLLDDVRVIPTDEIFPDNFDGD